MGSCFELLLPMYAVVVSVIPRFLWCESVNCVFFSSYFELERITKGMKKIHFPSIYGLKFVTKHNNTGYNTFYDSQRFCANKYHRRQKKMHHQEMLIQSMLIASAPWIIVNIKNICFSKSQKKNGKNKRAFAIFLFAAKYTMRFAVDTSHP